MCIARYCFFLPNTASKWAPRRWDPFHVQGVGVLFVAAQFGKSAARYERERSLAPASRGASVQAPLEVRAGGSNQTACPCGPARAQKVSRKISPLGSLPGLVAAARTSAGMTRRWPPMPVRARRGDASRFHGYRATPAQRPRPSAGSCMRSRLWIIFTELWTISRFGVPRWLGVVCGQPVEADPCRRRTTGRNRLRRIGAKSPSASSTRYARHTQRNTLRWSSRAIRFQRLPTKLSLARSP